MNQACADVTLTLPRDVSPESDSRLWPLAKPVEMTEK